LQLAVACELAVAVATDPALDELVVEGGADICDIELRTSGRVVAAVQVKSRAEHLVLRPADIAEIVRAFGDLEADEFWIYTDTGVSQRARHGILSCGEALAAGEMLDDYQVSRLVELGLQDAYDVLARLQVRSRYGDPAHLLGSARMALLEATGMAVSAAELDRRVRLLFSELAEVGGDARLWSRTLSAATLRELLGVDERPPGQPSPQRSLALVTSSAGRPAPDDGLLDRRELQEEATNLLLGEGDRPVVLKGLPGCGKTELAIQIADRAAGYFADVRWLAAGDTAALAGAVRELLVAQAGSSERMSDDRAVLAEFIRVLDSGGPTLVVLDDVPGPAAFREWGLHRAARVLITSRHPAWGRGAAVVDVDVFSPAEAEQVLLAGRSPGEEEWASALAEQVGRLPLAVTQAAAFMRLTGCPLHEFSALLAERLDVLDVARAATDAEGHSNRTALATLLLLVDQFEDPLAQSLIGLLARFGSAPVSRGLLTAAIGYAADSRTYLEDPVAVDASLAELHAAAVVRIDTRGVTMHSLTGRAALHRLHGRPGLPTEVRLDPALRAAALATVHAALPDDALDTGRWARGAEVLPAARHLLDDPVLLADGIGADVAGRVIAFDHIQGRLADAAALAERALACHDEPATRARLLHALGRTGLKTGEFDVAVDRVAEAIRLLDALDLRETVEYATVEVTFGSLLDCVGDVAGQVHLEHALEVQRRELDPSDKRIARTLIELGVVLSQRGDGRAAEMLEREALAIVDRPGADAGVDLARGLGNLAGTLSDMPEREAEAIVVARRALEVTADVYGAEHPEVAYPLTVIGTLQASEDPEQAIVTLLEALRLRRAAFGDTHEQVAYTLHHIGRVLLLDARDADRALPWLEQAYGVLLDIFDEEHIETATAGFDLGQAVVLADPSDARGLRLLDSAARTMGDVYGPAHHDVQLAARIVDDVRLGRPPSRD
jgi:tetratricopeptide (TPR) repeat protein